MEMVDEEVSLLFGMSKVVEYTLRIGSKVNAGYMNWVSLGGGKAVNLFVVVLDYLTVFLIEELLL